MVTLNDGHRHRHSHENNKRPLINASQQTRDWRNNIQQLHHNNNIFASIGKSNWNVNLQLKCVNRLILHH